MQPAQRFLRTARMGHVLLDISKGQRSLIPAVSRHEGYSNQKQRARASTSVAYLTAAPPDPHTLTEAYDSVRMGSLAGRAKIHSEDKADQDVEAQASSMDATQLPSTRLGLLERCRSELCSLPPMIGRSFIEAENAEHIASPDTIRIMQWNILAQSLAEKSDKFVCPEEALHWNFRRWRILEEVLTYGADIICLQEVDHYNFLKATLGRVGFQGCFFPKPDSPCCYIKGNNGPDGCAVFFDASKYTLLKTEQKVLEVFRCQSNQVVVMCTFQRKLDNRMFCVVTTHLKARVGALLPTLRNEQGKDLLQFVKSNNPQNLPVIYTGDFNAEPSEPVYRTMIQLGEVSSSYAMVSPEEQEPEYTTWKIREEGEVCHTIDYIFYSRNNFSPERVLSMPSEEQLGEGKAPSLAYPSDHFSLCCDLRLL